MLIKSALRTRESMLVCPVQCGIYDNLSLHGLSHHTHISAPRAVMAAHRCLPVSVAADE